MNTNITHFIMDKYFFYCEYLKNIHGETVPIINTDDSYYILYNHNKGYNINEFKIKFPSDGTISFGTDICYYVEFKDDIKEEIINKIRYRYNIVILKMENNTLNISDSSEKIIPCNNYTISSILNKILFSSSHYINSKSPLLRYRYGNTYNDNVYYHLFNGISQKYSIEETQIHNLICLETKIRSHIQIEYDEFIYRTYIYNEEKSQTKNIIKLEIDSSQQQKYSEQFTIINELQRSSGIKLSGTLEDNSHAEIVDFEYINNNCSNDDIEDEFKKYGIRVTLSEDGFIMID
jgi:hypothetical protein